MAEGVSEKVLTELARSINEQSTKIGELVGEMRQVNVSHMEVKTELGKHDERIHNLELDSARNEPTMNATKDIFSKVREWVVMLGIAAIAYYLSLKK